MLDHQEAVSGRPKDLRKKKGNTPLLKKKYENMKFKAMLNRRLFLHVISMQQCFKYPKLVLTCPVLYLPNAE